MIHKGQELELQIESLALDGKSVARVGGFVCFVTGGVPGDRLRAHVVKVKKNFAEAEILEVLSPSPQRTRPECKFFGTCGGCRWQHVEYAAQLRAKQQHVIDSFERIAELHHLPLAPIMGCEDIYFYRNKIEFSFSRQRWLTVEELADKEIRHKESGLGFYVKGRFEKVLDIDECWLQSRRSNAILAAVRSFCRREGLSIYSTKSHEGYLRHLVIREGKRTGEVMVNLVTTTDEPEVMRAFSRELLDQIPEITTIVNNITDRKSMVAMGDREKVYHGHGYITEVIGDYRFRVSANSFFQTNTAQGERLFGLVATLGELSIDDVVFDLYCGTGTISTYVSGSVQEVIGIDIVPSAIEDARLNVELNGVRNCRFLLGDLKDRLTKDTSWVTKKPSVVILDPPRSGLHPRVVEEVASLQPERIVYVSCNPATQARDVKLFLNSGYGLSALQPVDMFPQTSHVENIAVLRRRATTSSSR